MIDQALQNKQFGYFIEPQCTMIFYISYLLKLARRSKDKGTRVPHFLNNPKQFFN